MQEIGITSSRADLSWRSHAILLLVFLLLTVSTGVLQTSFTFFVTHWMTAFGAARTQVMSLISIQIAATGLVSIAVGKWLDAVAPRPLILGGLACLALGAVIVSMAPNLWTVMAVYAFLNPLAGALIGPLAAITLITRTFEQGRGMVIGVAMLGISAAGMIFPLLVVLLLRQGDWRSAFLLIGVVPAALVAPLAWAILSGESAAQPSRRGTGPQPIDRIAFLRRGDFWILVIAFQAVLLVGSGLNHNLRPFAADLGIDAERTALIVGLMSACNVAGKLGVGFLCDRIDKRFLFVAGALLMNGAAALLWLGAGFAAVCVAYCLLGFALGGFLSLRGAIYASIFNPQIIGRALGLAAPFAIVTAAGPVALSGLRELGGSYDNALLAIIAFLLLVAPIALLLPRRSAHL